MPDSGEVFVLEKHPIRQPVLHRPRTESLARGRVAPVYAAVFDLAVGDFDHAVATVRRWVRTHKTVGDHPTGDGAPWFALDRFVDEGLIAEVAVTTDERTVAARLIHREGADRWRGLGGDPARTWRTEATVSRDDRSAWLAVRVWYTGLETDNRLCKPPTFIRQLWNETLLSDGVTFGETTWTIEYPEDVELVGELILDTKRDFPVVLIATGSPLQIEWFARQSTGLAHVCAVSEEMRPTLALHLGQDRSLHRGSVRTYYPLVPGREIVAPAAFPRTILEWKFNGESGAAAFGAFLREDLGRTVTRRLVNDSAHRTFEDVKASAIQAERTTLAAADGGTESIRLELNLAIEQNDLLKIENSNLLRNIRYQNELEKEYAHNDRAQQQIIDDLRLSLGESEAELSRLRLRAAALEHALNAKGLSPSDDLSDRDIEALIADNRGFPDVAAAVTAAARILAEHGENIVFSASARDAAQDSPFKRPDDVFAALIRLGFYWSDIRASGQRLDSAGHDRIRFPMAMHESQSTKNRHRDERKIRHDNEELILEKHIKLGSGGPDASLRIYFGDKEGQVLVGYVGRHLTIGSTQ